MVATAFTILLLALGAIFALFLLALLIGLMRPEGPRTEERPSVTVVVAARNEERTIRRCVRALLAQDYPPGKLQIVVVDDRSEDRTAALVEELVPAHSHLELVRVTECPPNWSPKKHAINMGIDRARGEIIMCTDADCEPPPTWVTGVVSYFTPEVGLVTGRSCLVSASTPWLVARLLELDSLAMACVAAGGVGLGVPLTCTGTNLSYRKKVYQAVGGFAGVEHLLSGDDDLLLHKVGATSWRIRYAWDPRTVVTSSAPESFAHFGHQRARHASKGFFYAPWLTALLVAIYFFHCALLVAVPLATLGLIAPWVLGAGLALAWIPELLLVGFGAARFRRWHLWPLLPLGALLYIPYVVIFATWGALGKFSWKGTTARKGVRIAEAET
ncbi:MAG: glycosyltransferase [candidate division KSB1 bacterium]|nr:glycosyltransferase [candidate division KSB1 bacterium]